MPRKGITKYEDLVLGEEEFENNTMSDRVLRFRINIYQIFFLESSGFDERI